MTTTDATTALPFTAPTPEASSRLRPEDDFPNDLAALGKAELQVLHSRVTRQLDREYLTDPAGPHPCTLDRCQDLLAELDARDTRVTPPGPAPIGTP